MLLLLVPATIALGREQITLQKAGSNQQLRAADTSLDQANPTNVNGASSTFRVQSLASGNQRTIVKIDFFVVPSAGIKSATLTLNVVAAATLPRTYNAHRVTSFWTESDACWNNRVMGLAWGSAGGDFNATATASFNIGPTSTSASWNITADVQSWYTGTPNYGTLIKDGSESSALAVFTDFSSKEDPTPANRPQLTLTFVQNVNNLTTIAGNGTANLTWSYPAAIGTVLEANTGVLILRRAGQPVGANSFPTDGTNPALCTAFGSALVVFNNTSGATSFVDNSSDPCGGPANGTTYFYKVFVRDSANNYSASGTGGQASVFVPEISATPSATAPQNSLWVMANRSTNLAAPGLIPGSSVLTGGSSNRLYPFDANSGNRPCFGISIGGPTTGQPPVLDASTSSLGRPVAYFPSQDDYVYAVDPSTGEIIWVANPTGLTTNDFVGAAAVQVKAFSDRFYTLPTNLVVVGTRNGGTTTGNIIVGMDGDTGATVWQVIGNSGTTPPMDIVASTPFVDYVNRAIWIASNSASGTTQPSLWKINPNTGAVMATANLGDISGSPTLTPAGDVLFVGNDSGTLFAINPATGATLASFAGGDAFIYGYPLVLNFSSPYTVIISGQNLTQALSYNAATRTFTRLWSTSIVAPSAPLSFTGLGKIYVTGFDGLIHELDLATGTDSKQRIVHVTGIPALVSDPALDVTLSRIYVTANDQRVYAFAFPF
jgi:hypothetical protein